MSLTLDTTLLSITDGEHTARLSRQHLKFLFCLFKAYPSVVSYERLHALIWPLDPPENIKTVQVLACRTKVHLKAFGLENCIKNVWGIGYAASGPAEIIGDLHQPPAIEIAGTLLEEIAGFLMTHPHKKAALLVLDKLPSIR